MSSKKSLWLLIICLFQVSNVHALKFSDSRWEIAKVNLHQMNHFRTFIAINCIHNLGIGIKNLSEEKYWTSLGHLALAACSAATVLFYPRKYWYSYSEYSPINESQAFNLSLVAIVSCLDAALVKTFLHPVEKLPRCLLCFNQLKHTCAFIISHNSSN